MHPENRWINIIEGINLANNSRRAWKTIRKINTIKQTERKTVVTPMKTARQLIENGVQSRLKSSTGRSEKKEARKTQQATKGIHKGRIGRMHYETQKWQSGRNWQKLARNDHI